MEERLMQDVEGLAAGSSWVQGLARRLVDDADLADEVVQEAWLRAVKSAGSRRGSLGAWLTGVVRNLAADVGRRGARDRAGLERVEPAGPAADTAVLAERVEAQRLLAEAVLALGDPYRDAVLLRFYEDLPPREIARRLGVPVATVQSRLKRALAQLRERLDRDHGLRQAWVVALVPLLVPSGSTWALWTTGAMMKSKTKVAAAVAAVVVLGTWLITSNLEGDDGEILDRSDAALVGDTDARPDVRRQVSEQGSKRDRVVTPLTPEPRQTPPLAPRGDHRIVVRHGDTGAIVPGAEVFTLDWFGLREKAVRELGLDMRQGAGVSRMPFFRRHGTRYVADAHGVVFLDTVGAPSGLQILAHSEGLEGSNNVRSELEQVLVWPAKDLTVRVRTRDGRPAAGVPVGLQYSMGGGMDRPQDVAETDREGVATLRFRRSQQTPRTARSRLAVGFGFPLAKPELHVLDEDRWPTEPVVLTLPDVGRVRVDAVDGAGQPVPDGTFVYLTRGQQIVDGLRRPTIGGVALFSHVGLDIEGLRVGATLAMGQPAIWKDTASPTVQHQEVRTVLTIEARTTILAGRMLDDEGTPLANARFMIAVPSEAPQTFMAVFDTDEDGRFDVKVVEYRATPVGGTFIVRRFSETEYGQATFDLASLPSASPYDVGDLTMPQIQPTLAGVVVDPDGNPMPGVLIEPLRVARIDGNEGWEPSAMGDVRSGRDGEFSISPAPVDEIVAAIRVTPRGAWAREIVELPTEPFARRALRIVLRPASTLSGRLILPDGLEADRFSVRLWPRTNARKRLWSISGWVSTARQVGGTFHFDGLEPGVYDLGVGFALADTAAIYVDQIVVGETPSTDPRLEPLDLREYWRMVDVDVRDEKGQPLEAHALALWSDGSTDQMGRIRRPMIVSKAVPLDALVISAEDHFPALVRTPGEKARVTLTRGMEVRVALPDSIDTRNLQVFFVPEGSASGDKAARHLQSRSPSRATCEGRHEVTMRVPGGGRYAVRYRVTRHTEKGTPFEHDVTGAEPEVVVIPDSGGENPVRIRGPRGE